MIIIAELVARSWVTVLASPTMEEDGGARTITTLIARLGLSLSVENNYYCSASVEFLLVREVYWLL